ncbi:hypothetical protein ACO229_24685 [Promicromonospora sp. MS192]|uniref:hypothetical protein n=1 Tax=Promicromonospora sp. MS192 TaxID=3412684 RepID=UPI003C2FB141
MAAPPERVAAVVERALTDQRPWARYLTGAAAALMTAVLRRALPTRAIDTVLGVMRGLPTRVAD